MEEKKNLNLSNFLGSRDLFYEKRQLNRHK